ncbi:hypothetical protein BDB01DRAFT_791468 [Pilobolus umbonatus]|nr:hypothetical protein BDB01DRAFT_791468 [Pilobolus umbonatus]
MSSILLFLLICLLHVRAQTSIHNPFIWQVLTTYNQSYSPTAKHYLIDTSYKVYSQDFQTVFENKDYYGYNQRLLIDLGDACSPTTLEVLDKLNGKTTTTLSMMSHPSIGLVQRGGRCDLWSEKIAVTQELSLQHQLQITGIMIYNTAHYKDVELVFEKTDNTSYPTWQTPLPVQRDIQSMKGENNIDIGTTFIAVYFAPREYVNYLKNMLLPRAFYQNNEKQYHLQLTFYMTEDHFITKNEDEDPYHLGQNKNIKMYVIYATVISAIIIIGCFAIKCCLLSNRGLGRAEQNTYEPHNMLLDLPSTPTPKTISLMDVDRRFPMILYNDLSVSIKNKSCAICLDDFKDKYYIRVLDCNHGYCTACIDVWFTMRSVYCPICKNDCSVVTL